MATETLFIDGGTPSMTSPVQYEGWKQSQPQSQSQSQSQPQSLRQGRSVQHSIKEFGQGVGLMAETGSPDTALFVSGLVEQIVTAMRKEAQAHAAVSYTPRLPAWAVNLLVGVTTALLSAIVAGLVTYGALQNRVSVLESAHPEGLAALAVEVHLLNQNVEAIQTRLNDLYDRDRDRGSARH